MEAVIEAPAGPSDPSLLFPLRLPRFRDSPDLVELPDFVALPDLADFLTVPIPRSTSSIRATLNFTVENVT